MSNVDQGTAAARRAGFNRDRATLDVLALEPPAWSVDALCGQVDPDLWFPEKGGSTREAKRVCTGCPVQPDCLAYALENAERFGIWGGLSERERRRLLRRRAA